MKKVFKAIATGLLCLLLMAAFYIAVILGDPQGDAASPQPTPRQDQPLLSAMPHALLITDERDMDALLSAFPAPMLCAAHGNALTFMQGQCRDASFEGGLARVASLTYRTETGDELTLTSIYPARALSLMGKGDYVLSGMEGPAMAGLRAVRMENAASIRLHAQGPDALYTLTLPKTNAAVLRQLTAALQLAEGSR